MISRSTKFDLDKKSVSIRQNEVLKIKIPFTLQKLLPLLRNERIEDNWFISNQKNGVYQQ